MLMKSDTRKTERFDDMGRVDIPAVSPMSGVLDNISTSGCKIHYQFPVTVSEGEDLEISIIFARAAMDGPVKLLCHAKWIKVEDGCTEIGLKFLPSRELVHIYEYIEELNQEEKTDSLADQIAGSICGSI